MPVPEFKLSTNNPNDAFYLKVLSDLLKNTITEGNLIVDESGVRLRETNKDETTIVNFVLRGADMTFDPPAVSGKLGFTAARLYDELRRVKKRDILHIACQQGEKTITFNMINKEKDRDKTGSVLIKEVPESDWELPVYPQNPITQINASEFQKTCREIAGGGNSKTVNIQVQKKGVMFSGGTSQLHSTSDKFGTWDPQGEIIYNRTFKAQQLSHLAKISGLNRENIMKLYCAGEGQPLMLVAPIGSIGEFKVCITPAE